MADALNQRIATSRPERLAQLIHDVLDEPPASGPQDAAAAFQDLLSTPCRKCFAVVPSRLENPSLAAPGLPETVRTLLFDPHPPLDSLRAVKDFVKEHPAKVNEATLREARTAVYFLVIAVALVRCGTRFTRLGSPEMREGFAWLQAQPWIEEPFKALADAATKCLQDTN